MNGPRPGRAFLFQAAGLAALFVAVTAIAKLVGAADWGTAAGIGQIAFVLGLVALLLRS